MRWFVAQAPQVDEMNGTRTEMADANGHATDPAIRGQSGSRHAPVYTVPRRSFSAVEHPMLVRDIDKGIATFGRKFNFQEVLQLEDSRAAIPLYLRPDNPSVRPLTSHNAATHNVLLKVTVPKRTGRKRKRGSHGPFEWPAAVAASDNRRPVEVITDGPEIVDPALEGGAGQNGSVLGPAQGRTNGASGEAAHPTTNMSRSGMDNPAILRRKLQDNIGKYTVEPVGIVHNTHRFRGLSDFQYSMSGSNFMTTFVGQVMPGSIPEMRQYAIKTGTAQPPNIDLMPPPFFAPHGMPNVYNYSQNPFVRGSDGANVPTYDNPPEFVLPSSSESEEDSDASDDSVEFNKVVNTSMRGAAPGYFIRYNDFPAPLQPRMPPDETDPHVKAVMGELKAAMEDRPAWTRRSMFNRLSSAVSSLPKSGNIIKHCIQYAGYQFRGGPWRDSLVKYGVDPRISPELRIYQTLIFKLHKRQVGNVGGSWQSVRRKEVSTLSGSFGRYWRGVDDGIDRSRSHIFDGKSFSTDGKVWQVCDITDPLLKKLFDEAVPNKTCDFEKSGWYSPVLWCVAKAIMKRKMLALRFKRDIPDSAFDEALEIVRKAADGQLEDIDKLTVPLPPLHLSAEEREQIRGRRVKSGRKGRERDKNKNAPLRIRHVGSDKPQEVRIVHYPGDDRRLEDMPEYPASVVEGSRLASTQESVRAEERRTKKVDIAADEPETLEELMESEFDDQEDDDDDDEEDEDDDDDEAEQTPEPDDEEEEEEEEDDEDVDGLEEDAEDYGDEAEDNYDDDNDSGGEGPSNGMTSQ